MPELRDLRICFLALTLGQGGAERQLYYNLKVLRKNNVDVRLMTLDAGSYWEEPIRDLGVPVFHVGQSHSRAARLVRIVNELRRNPAHILQSQHLYVNLYVSVVARLLGISEIGAIRNDGVTGLNQIGRLASYFTLRAPRLIAANSRAAIENVTAQGVPPKRLFFLPNVVDTDLFIPDRAPSNGQIKLVTVGRLVEQKRFDRFLNTLHSVRQHSDLPVKGIIVGPGPLRHQLEEQAATLELDPNALEFKGKVDDVAPLYQQADLFLLTSDWEGTPNVVMEAMASGLPVVATKVGDVPHLIDHGENGYLVEPGDEESMVRAVHALIRNPEQRIRFGRSAREHIVQNYSLLNLPLALQELYGSAISKRE